MKKLILSGLLCTFLFPAFGQDFIDNALLFSRTQRAGSARIQGVGGAQTALGGDFSSALSNPGGLGMFNKNEFTFSAGLNFLNSSSTFLNNDIKDSKTAFSVPALSIVIHTPSRRETGFLGGAFGISVTRTNDFQQVFRYDGDVGGISIIDYFIEDAGNIDPEEMMVINGSMGSYFKSLTGLAYNNYLIDEVRDDNGDVVRYNSILNFSRSNQSESSERTGGQYQWSFAYGANFSDKFFAGATFGISTIRYKLVQKYREDSFQFSPGFNPIDDFSLEEQFDLQGTGFSGTIGAIYRPVNFLQVGASYSTPVAYSLRDKYFASMETNWNEPEPENIYEDFREADVIEYRLNTPARIRTGITFINKMGFITGDIEVVNYSNAKYREKDNSFPIEDSNADIAAELTSAVNIALGGELRLKNFRYRLGWNLMQEPYLDATFNNSAIDRKLTSYSTGVGYRGSNFFVDLTGIYSTTEGQRIPYFLNNADTPIAAQEFNSVKIIATVGLNF